MYMAVLTSTHNLCFGANIRKIGMPLHTPISLYKSGIQGYLNSTDMFWFPDVETNTFAQTYTYDLD